MLESKFIEIDGEQLIAHQWDEYNGTLISNWKNGARGGRPRNPRESHGITHGITHAVGNASYLSSQSSQSDQSTEGGLGETPIPPDVNIPTVEEVIAFGASLLTKQVPEGFCRAYWGHRNEHNAWWKNGKLLEWRGGLRTHWDGDWGIRWREQNWGKKNGQPQESFAEREARIARQEREAEELKRKEIAEAKALGAQPMGNFLNKFKEEEAKREKRMQNPNYHPDA